jgi:hypothetical protein
MLLNSDPEASHLIGRAGLCHKAYGFLAEAATGKRLGPEESEGRPKLLNGVYQDKSNSKRVPNTGLKHHKYNKMLLKSRKFVLDGNAPRIIIIPLLTVPEVLGWNGRDNYEVMAITCGSLATAGAEELLQFVGHFCSPEEIEKGRILLEAFTRGIASSIKQHNVTESFSVTELRSQGLAAWSALVRETKMDDFARISLPQALPSRTEGGLPSKPMAKAEMSRMFSLPDPFLVAVKAAVSYSKLCGRTLMSACPDPESDASFDDNDDESASSDDRSLARDFSSVTAFLVNPGRRQVELYSDDSQAFLFTLISSLLLSIVRIRKSESEVWGRTG